MAYTISDSLERQDKFMREYEKKYEIISHCNNCFSLVDRNSGYATCVQDGDRGIICANCYNQYSDEEFAEKDILAVE
ncbi:hypothetical protein OAA60_00850 [Porticoccaceae bacterium]|nr:hypothetical protein [Porticoccaceae bacterium]